MLAASLTFSASSLSKRRVYVSCVDRPRHDEALFLAVFSPCIAVNPFPCGSLFIVIVTIRVVVVILVTAFAPVVVLGAEFKKASQFVFPISRFAASAALLWLRSVLGVVLLLLLLLLRKPWEHHVVLC